MRSYFWSLHCSSLGYTAFSGEQSHSSWKSKVCVWCCASVSWRTSQQSQMPPSGQEADGMYEAVCVRVRVSQVNDKRRWRMVTGVIDALFRLALSRSLPESCASLQVGHGPPHHDLYSSPSCTQHSTTQTQKSSPLQQLRNLCNCPPWNTWKRSLLPPQSIMLLAHHVVVFSSETVVRIIYCSLHRWLTVSHSASLKVV